jgi:hypothetical protein
LVCTRLVALPSSPSADPLLHGSGRYFVRMAATTKPGHKPGFVVAEGTLLALIVAVQVMGGRRCIRMPCWRTGKAKSPTLRSGFLDLAAPDGFEPPNA